MLSSGQVGVLGMRRLVGQQLCAWRALWRYALLCMPPALLTLFLHLQASPSAFTDARLRLLLLPPLLQEHPWPAEHCRSAGRRGCCCPGVPGAR